MSPPLLPLLVLCLQSTESPPPSLDEILRHTIERAECSRQDEERGTFWLELTSVVVKLDGNGLSREVDERLYEVGQLGGDAAERLVERNGRRPTRADEQHERAQRDREAKRRSDTPDRDDDRVDLDEELLRRYVTTLEGTATLGGRAAYVVAFAPKPGDLPVKRWADRALNRTRGRAWIDTETYEIAALDFELTEKVKLWWGIAGSISSLEGRLEQAPSAGAEGAWLPSGFQMQLAGRVLLRSIHQLVSLTWRDLSTECRD